MFVKDPAAADEPPITTPSIVPPLISAVVTVPRLAIVVPANVLFALTVRVSSASDPRIVFPFTVILSAVTVPVKFGLAVPARTAT